MVTYYVTKMIMTSSPMMGQMFDTVIVAGSDKEWVITTHQNLIVGNCFEPPEILAGGTVDYGPLN